MLALGWIAAAAAGDVWLTADARNHDGRVQLDLPAAILRDPAEVTTTDGTRVDLADVVREVGAMPEGGSRTLDVGAAHLVFTHRPVPARGVTRLRVAITVPRGRGSELTLPLDGSALGTATAQRGLRVDGLSLVITGDGVADAIRRGSARTLVDALDADGTRVRIASQ